MHLVGRLKKASWRPSERDGVAAGASKPALSIKADAAADLLATLQLAARGCPSGGGGHVARRETLRCDAMPVLSAYLVRCASCIESTHTTSRHGEMRHQVSAAELFDVFPDV